MANNKPGDFIDLIGLLTEHILFLNLLLCRFIFCIYRGNRQLN